MSRIFLIRHGTTDWNLSGRLQGHSDLGLNARGLEQAAAVAARLKAEKIDLIYSSDLKRAWKTATIIAAEHGMPVTTLPELREIHFGDWEGQTYASIQAREPHSTESWKKDLTHFAPPGGESLAQMAARVADVLARLNSSRAEDCLAIVAHGGPLQVLLCLALGLPPERYWQFHLATASISQLSLYPEGAILDFLNDTHHLNHLQEDAS